MANAVENVLAAFPWMRELNIAPMITEMIQDNPNVSDEAIVSEIQIGRAHVRTPVTSLSRMPSSA